MMYIGTKVVKASAMTRGTYNVYRGWELPADQNGEDAGYLVEYTDGGAPNHSAHVGYISWSPKAQFDNAYRKTEGLTFGIVIEALKLGSRVARAGWNGKGMFVYYVPPGSYPARTGAALDYFGEAPVPYNAYFAIKNVNDTVSTWVPSINDCLAEDWQVL